MAALDEDAAIFGSFVGQRSLHLVDIGKLTERRLRPSEFAADKPHVGDAGVLEQSNDTAVFLGTDVTQFAHVSEYGHLAVDLHVAEILYRGCHAGRVGVVGIDDEAVGGGDGELRAVVARHIVLQGTADVRRSDTEMETDGDGGQHVVHVVGSDEMGGDLMPPVACGLGLPTEAEERGATGDLTAHGDPLSTAVADRPGQSVGNGHQQRIVGIDECDAILVGAQEVIEFALGVEHALQRTETLKMGAADIGDQSAGRLDQIDQRADVAGMACSHLDDGNIMFGSETEERLWHADVVVEIAFGEEDIVTAGQNGGDEFLGGRLAIGAGDADDGNGEPAAMVAGQLLERLQTVVDEDAARIGGIRGVVHHGPGTTLLQRGCGKTVAVERRAFEGEED